MLFHDLWVRAWNPFSILLVHHRFRLKVDFCRNLSRKDKTVAFFILIWLFAVRETHHERIGFFVVSIVGSMWSMFSK